MKFLQEYADKKRLLALQGLELTADEEIFRNTKAKRLLSLVERFSSLSGELPVSELLSKLLDESGYEALLRTEGSQERLDNLAELKQSVHEFEVTCGEETTLESYLAHAALMTGSDASSGRNAVKMMTVHTAKGLEFPYVFLCGLMEGVFPSKKVLSREAMEEERRLCFVAFTRAGKALYLSDSGGRNLDGSFRYPSRFIFNVDRDLLHYTSPLEPRLVCEARAAIDASDKMLERLSAAPSFAPGDRIVHSVMGPGEVVAIDADKNAYTVKFDKIPTPRKISMKTKLERHR
jgi:DNA helicase-2/ATP-dependent DNA helicase PcrA